MWLWESWLKLYFERNYLVVYFVAVNLVKCDIDVIKLIDFKLFKVLVKFIDGIIIEIEFV